MPTVPDLDALGGFCSLLAEECREISLRYFRCGVEFAQKEDLSPVTVADQAVEAHLRDRLRGAFPAHGIVGEEMAPEAGHGLTWFIDPIDGTKSFISGMPCYGLLMALRDVEAGRTLLGMIDIPAMGERWLGHSGETWFQGLPARTSECESLAQAQVYTTSPDIFSEADWRTFDQISRAARFRRFGGDCYLYGLLASGHCDLVMECSLYTFDFMALIPIVEGAGGMISDWDGKALTEASDGRVIAAATPELHAEVLGLMRASDRAGT